MKFSLQLIVLLLLFASSLNVHSFQAIIGRRSSCLRRALYADLSSASWGLLGCFFSQIGRSRTVWVLSPLREYIAWRIVLVRNLSLKLGCAKPRFFHFCEKASPFEDSLASVMLDELYSR